MAIARDFEFVEDLVIQNGDFKVIDSDKQHEEHILRAEKGHFYQFPTLGGEVVSLINSSETNQKIRQSVQENLQADNFRVNQVLIDRDAEGNLEIKTDAIRRK